MPQGVEFKLDPKDPAFIAARNFALEAGLSKEQWSKMLGLFASHEIASASQINNARAAEIAKLGANAAQRLDAIQRFWTATYGEADAKLKMSRLWSAEDVRVAEREVARGLTQGGTGPTPPREPGPSEGKVDEARWNTMSARERLDYARQFPQEQFTRGNGASR